MQQEMFSLNCKCQQKKLLARAINREHFLLHCLKKEIATSKELDLRQLGKVLIFRDRTLLLYIDNSILCLVAEVWL